MNAAPQAFRPPPVPRVTVVVLTRNHVRQTIETVARLTALPEAPDIVLADNGSTDATVALVGSLFPRVRIVQGLRNLGTAGFNRALALVHTDYAACCDDRTWWEPGALAQAVRLLDAHPRVAVLDAQVAGAGHAATDPPPGGDSPGGDHDAALPGPALASYAAGACVLRVSVFRALGGYDERLRQGAAEALAALDLLSAGHAIVHGDDVLAHRAPPRRTGNAAARCALARNAAWVAWMRLPVRDALGATAHALAVFARQRALGPAGLALFAGTRWALARRHVVPRQVAQLYRACRAQREAHAGIPELAEKEDRSGQRAW
ncbi:glycosyltransferase [Burkholderia sp. WAC0059]|uniref:glycosyltransferase n=1 Tax=Burkholderia sp. WAC0059 TaxID=2066022 RepID=UPI0015E0640A|nr:glycosyltransferase [Burkholderia sp. WAC0059]